MGTFVTVNSMPVSTLYRRKANEFRFLALSATVGNPQDFKNWLARVQSQKEVQLYNKSNPESVKLILHNQRYSDLQKYIFTTPFKESVAENPRTFNFI